MRRRTFAFGLGMFLTTFHLARAAATDENPADRLPNDSVP